MTEPYVAYGATRDLIKECARPGEYTIPQALQKGAEIPTIENGVHLGEGEGWWYESKCHWHQGSCCAPDIMLILNSSWPQAHIRQLDADHLPPHVHDASALQNAARNTCQHLDPASDEPCLLRRRGPAGRMAQVQREFAPPEAPQGHVLAMACCPPVV